MTDANARDELVERLLASRAMSACIPKPRPTWLETEAAARIQADAAVIAGMTWQPIETAPRDGTWILLTGGVYHDETGERPSLIAAKWMTISGFPAWIVGYLQSGFHYSNYDDPSHWMPLPIPPSAGDQTERVKGEGPVSTRSV
jgi:hypothetical protein